MEVLAAGATLRVTMSEGSLAEVTDSQFPSTEPFRWESSWSLAPGGLRLASRGLYYLLPPKDCTVTLLDASGAQLGSLQLASDTSPFLTYFEGARTIRVVSAALGTLDLTTDAKIVQVEVPSYPETGLFELDFDHSFKDRGQLDVQSEVVLPLASGS